LRAQAPSRIETPIERPLPTEPAPAHVEPAKVPSPVPVEPSPLARESALLTDALKRLHQSHDPRGALALLDDYAHRFPAGALANEGRIARLDALLALGKRGEALHVIESIDLSGVPRAGELTTLRGELRAEAGRCREAIADFDHVLGKSEGRIEERALYGRGACRSRMGDVDGARRDLESYLVRFPGGTFADKVKKALSR
jgi:hypothetical protein